MQILFFFRNRNLKKQFHVVGVLDFVFCFFVLSFLLQKRSKNGNNMENYWMALQFVFTYYVRSYCNRFELNRSTYYHRYCNYYWMHTIRSILLKWNIWFLLKKIKKNNNTSLRLCCFSFSLFRNFWMVHFNRLV